MDLLTQPETAGETRLSERTLERHRLAGTGPKFVRLGRRVFYRRHDVNEWIVEHVCRSTSEAGTKAGRGDERDVQCENSGGAAAENIQAGISQDVEQPDHPHPPSAGKVGPIDSERYRARNKSAEFSSAPVETRAASHGVNGEC
jgi:predicted DNA-binding transcriptional regulator AlpA